MTGKPTFDQLMTAKIAMLDIVIHNIIVSQKLAPGETPQSVRKWADDFVLTYENHPQLAGPEGLLVIEALREFLDRVVAAREALAD